MFSSTYPYPVTAFKLSIFKFHNIVIQLQLQESELRQSRSIYSAHLFSLSNRGRDTERLFSSG